MDYGVNGPRIAMEGEHHRSISREVLDEGGIVQTMGMKEGRIECHQVNDVDDADLQRGQVLAEQIHRGERLQRGHIAAAGHDDVGLVALIVAGPLPDADAGRAMLDGLVHRQPLRSRLLAGDDEVDVVPAAEAMVGHRQQRVRVGWQVDADHLRLLVDDVVDEPGVLMAEPVMVLAPHVRGEQVVERGDRPPPGNMVAHLQPLGVLIEHGIDNVDERLVAGEKSVPAGQEIPFQPPLALVLAEHLHHAAVGRQVVVVRVTIRHPGSVGDLHRVLPAVRVVLVGTEEAEVPLVHVQLHDVAQERPHHTGGFGRDGTGVRHLDGIVAEVGQPQVLEQQAAVGMWIGAHAAFPPGCQRGQLGGEPPGLVE